VEQGLRQLRGFPDQFARGLLIAITVTGAGDVLNVASYAGVAYHRSQALALVFGLAAVYIFLKFPAFRSKTPETAVEAVASSGGLIMPPVMGAAAFIMADFLGVSYAEVALAALVPATLFYVAVFYQVHFVAVRDDLKSAAVGAVPSLREMLPGSLMFFVPLALLVYFMFVRGITPERAVMYATASLLVLAVFLKRDALRWRALLGVLETTGRELIQMLVIAGLAGLILGVVTLKGLGSSMSQTLLALSSDSLLLLLVLTAVTSIVLGMGLPAVAIYILLAVLVAPAMVQFGVPPIAAHMFILYFGILSYVTPPMAFACFVTAPMAGADPIKTGVEGCKLSVVAYIVPFMFVYNPALLLHGSALEIAAAFASGAVAAICLAAAVRSRSPAGVAARAPEAGAPGGRERG
jgi:TRAP transporter 4TM/12TM fusion protein